MRCISPQRPFLNRPYSLSHLDLKSAGYSRQFSQRTAAFVHPMVGLAFVKASAEIFPGYSVLICNYGRYGNPHRGPAFQSARAGFREDRQCFGARPLLKLSWWYVCIAGMFLHISTRDDGRGRKRLRAGPGAIGWPLSRGGVAVSSCHVGKSMLCLANSSTKAKHDRGSQPYDASDVFLTFRRGNVISVRAGDDRILWT